LIHLFVFIFISAAYISNSFSPSCFVSSLPVLSCPCPSVLIFFLPQPSLYLLYLYIRPVFLNASLSFPLGSVFIPFMSLTVETTQHVDSNTSLLVKENNKYFSVSEFPGTSFGGPCKQKMPGSQVDGVLLSLIELLSPSLHTASNT
jgi:hypothetical protein